MLEGAGAERPASPLAELYADLLLETSSAQHSAGDRDRAIVTEHAAIAAYQQLFGPDSPAEARGWHNLSEELRTTNQNDAAIEAGRTAVRIREQRLGDSPNLAASLVTLATALGNTNQWSEALAAYDRALAIDHAQLRPDDPQLAAVMMGRGNALKHAGRLDEAARTYDDTIAFFERIGSHSVNLPITLYDRAELARQLGHCDAALADDARALAGMEEVRGKTHPILVYPLLSTGECLIALGRFADAIAPLQRAHALAASGENGALARFYLGCALVKSGRDKAGGLALARAARPELTGDDPAQLTEMDRCPR